MKTLKQKLLRFFFAVEIALFAYSFYGGAYGIRAIRTLEHQNQVLKKELMSAYTEVDQAREALTFWESEPFLKEKIAREHLQMARKDDVLFYTS